MEVVQRVPVGHGDVRQGSWEKAEAAIGRRVADDHVGSLLDLQETFVDSVGIQVP